MIPFIYGFVTLATLWAMGGGDAPTFWARQLPLAAILAALIFSLQRAQKADLKKLFTIDRKTALIALGAAVATALPVVFIMTFIKLSSLSALSGWKLELHELKPTNVIGPVALIALLSPASEVVWRGYLQKAWGISSVAFLHALNVGFGMQHLGPFLLIWGMAHLWGHLAKNFGLGTAALSRAIWTLLVVTALYFTA